MADKSLEKEPVRKSASVATDCQVSPQSNLGWVINPLHPEEPCTLFFAYKWEGRRVGISGVLSHHQVYNASLSWCFASWVFTWIWLLSTTDLKARKPLWAAHGEPCAFILGGKRKLRAIRAPATKDAHEWLYYAQTHFCNSLQDVYSAKALVHAVRSICSSSQCMRLLLSLIKSTCSIGCCNFEKQFSLGGASTTATPDSINSVHDETMCALNFCDVMAICNSINSGERNIVCWSWLALASVSLSTQCALPVHSEHWCFQTHSDKLCIPTQNACAQQESMLTDSR